ncbi:Uncharacterised protein [Bordetella pertussis]|nr:Uncharacterised protein [Bordetella pertussis]CPI19460.1 Uncharacterised protein [Bordetella pertussis]
MRVELRQQHDAGVGGQRELAVGQRVHVEHRRGHDEALVVEVLAVQEARADGPELAVVRQLHALEAAGRARGVEDHGRGAQRRRVRLERTRVEKFVPLRGVEAHRVQPGRRQRRARLVDEGQTRLAVLQQERQRVGRQLVVDRHGHHARAHDAQVGDQELGAVDAHQGDGVARFQALAQQAARAGVGQPVQVPVGVDPRRLVVEAVDQRNGGGVLVRVSKLAQIQRHDFTCKRHISSGKTKKNSRTIP